jgi:hypothetical protein
MKNRLLNLFLAIFCLLSVSAGAQVIDTTSYNPGIWQAFSKSLPSSEYPEIKGRLCNFYWRDLEVAKGVWDWSVFDKDLASRTEDGLPLIFMVYVRGPQGDAPDWLYINGVPKVIINDNNGIFAGYAPYYADSIYKSYLKKMIIAVHQHVETLPASVRSKIIGVQGCFGSTGDFISYDGGVVAPQYDLKQREFSSLFREFTQYYYDEYKNTNPKITLLSNPKNKGMEDAIWVVQNCPGWLKNSTLGKAFQLNDELDKTSWLYNLVNQPQAGNYIRMRCEIAGGSTDAGWWKKFPYKNMFGVMCYGIYWGLDWPNQDNSGITDPLFDQAFNFFNKYAGQKNPVKSTNALCVLKDALDASDEVRFPAATYGTVFRTNTQRYQNIVNKFSAFGAKLEDVNTATGTEMDELSATGTNDVGWRLLPGNYDRYLHQLTPNATSVGYWNVQSLDTNSMYGKFARGFDIANNKKALYFDVDSAFLSNAPLDGKYPVTIDVTYLDNGGGSWQLYYDSKSGANTPSIQVTCGITNTWKKASVTLTDAYFSNRGINGSDFYIKSTNSGNVIFAIVELARPNASLSNMGLFASTLSAFDTLCVNSMGVAKSFLLTGAFLDNSDVTVTPLAGYKFSTVADGTYSDSLIIRNDGASFSQMIYVKFSPTEAGSYNGNITVYGGNAVPINVRVTAISVNSSLMLSANIMNITCNNAKNGAIDLITTGGTAPFTYSWTNIDGFNAITQDISALKPATYTVTVKSTGGCSANASYTITQPNVLVTSLSADTMTCKGGTTTLSVTATGGTQPYSGTGIFTVTAGLKSYIVTDANGCADNESLSIPNGTLIAPSKPVSVSDAASDATGLCGVGDFSFSVPKVATATSYTWASPLGCTVSNTNLDGSTITLHAPANFSSGMLSVTANNVCGSSRAQTKTLSALPGKPGTIAGPTSATASQIGLKYSVPAVTGLTYTWTVPGEAKITAGQSTSQITVTWGSISGYVTVRASNNCGSSSWNNTYVTLTNALNALTQTENVQIVHQKEIMIYPNPAKDIAYLSFETSDEYKYTVELFDIRGKLLLQKSGIAQAGLNNVVVNVDQLTKGLYIVTFRNDRGERKTMKLIKG